MIARRVCSHSPFWRALATGGAIVLLVVSAGGMTAMFAAPASGAQDQPVARESLGERIKARYLVVPLRDGIGLVPKRPVAGVKIIELSAGTIALDGEVVTGHELRQRIGPDADLVVQLTYLDDRARRELLGPLAAVKEPEADERATKPTGEPERQSAEPQQKPAETNEPAVRRNVTRGDTVRVGGDVTVQRDETVDGDVVVIGGSARVDGEVTGEIVVVAGTLRLGSEAVVHRDVTVVAGSLDRSPGARVDGKIDEVGFGRNVNLREAARHRPFMSGPRGRFPNAVSVMATLLRLGLLILLAAIVVAVAPQAIERIGERAATEPLKAGAVGFLAQLLFVPVLVVIIIILAISIIGIPLLLLVPFLVVGALVALLVGFTGVAWRVGRWAAERIGWEARGPYRLAAAGIVTIVGLTLLCMILAMAGGLVARPAVAIAIVGIMLEYAVWTVGLGAAILARFGRQQPPTAAAGA